MTRKEAIEQLKVYRACMSVDGAEVEAYNMAINALNQLTSYERTINKLTKAISEQEPKTGRWKRIGYDLYECSICGQDVMTGDICAYKHCHGCGAHMKGGD